jgi:exodeoxyribonuclease VII large subunit
VFALETTIYSVSSLTKKIKLLLEDSFPALWVEGEISNYRPHYSGHLYFTLKDAKAQISCVMWRSRASMLPFAVEDGMKVRLFGNLKLYEKSGRYQIDILSLQPSGLGDLQQLFEQLKYKLQDEGLFNSEYKKKIPPFPRRIGVITSPTGAAIQDIISILKRRSPSVEIIIFGVKVQGEGAAEEIKHAIEVMNTYGEVDTLIVGRGGGSLEDLWPFNEESVARAIFSSKIPIISAVGHEVDFTIADFVADVRAPTPSAAAEIIAPDEHELRMKLLNLLKSINSILAEKQESLKLDIKNIMRSYAFRRPEDVVHQYFLRIDDMENRIYLAANNIMTSSNELVAKIKGHLESLNPNNVMKRGYSMIFKEGLLVKSVNDVEIKDIVSMKLQDGKVDSKIMRKYYG